MGDFNKIVNQWLGQYPKGQIPIESQARINALTDLFERFKDAGFPMEYFTNTVKSRITTNCINPNHANRAKKRKWIEYVAKHMEIAFYAVFDGDETMEENDMLAAPVSEEDMKVNIEEAIKENEKAKVPKKPKVEHYTDTVEISNESNNEIDPEMALLLGVKIK